jgi:hypothetical protein
MGASFGICEGYPPPFLMDSIGDALENRPMDLLQTALIAAVFVIAGVVKGISGMGLPTVAVSLLGIFMTPTEAAALLVLPSLATNVAQCRGPHLRALAQRLWPMWLGLVLACIFSPGPSVGAATAKARTFLGVVLVLYGVWGLSQKAVPRVSNQLAWAGLLPGSITGLITAGTAVFVIPMVPYLQILRLEKDAMIQALGLSFTVATVALAIRLHAADAVMVSVSTALALSTALAGIWVGSRLRSKLSQPMFQRILFVVFIGLGSVNLCRSI